MPQSHHDFRPVPTKKLVRIMLRNRCWPTAFHTIAAGDADVVILLACILLLGSANCCSSSAGRNFGLLSQNKIK
jgi:hypothetical protein